MNYQNKLIELIKQQVPSGVGLADEISDILKISLDSAYRRLRCETDISIGEAVKLCMHFNIPLESINEEIPHVVSFNVNNLTQDPETFERYLKNLLKDLEHLHKFEEKRLYYAAEDLPVFYHFYFPHLAKFKMAYWTKSILNVSEVQTKKIENVKTNEHWKELSERIAKLFSQIPTTEIWNEDTIKSTIRQIKFYWEAGFFESQKTALNVVDDLYHLIEYVKIQTDNSYKIHVQSKQIIPVNFTMYISDVMIGNNCVYLQANEKNSTYIGYNTFNYMRTSNAHFNNNTLLWMQNLISKSTLISGVAEKQRNQFFKDNFKQIEALRAVINE